MAALHEALKTLSPIAFSNVPVNNLKPFLSETFRDAELLIDSIPIPEPAEGSLTPSTSRSRSDTVASIASSSSDITLSSARPPPPPPEIESLQTQWGKPVRLNAKDNPLGISVYKLAGKDGKGAWFARRSVHEGLGFESWKRGLEKEFPETMKVQGGPGEGNIRGIGGERRVEYKIVEGVGKIEVYHLSAQFPGPTTPRDFVTLLLTSGAALVNKSSGLSEDKKSPRHFMVVSKPCIHHDCPDRDGFIRGQYQSIEFIREIPMRKSAKKSASTANLLEKDPSRMRSDSTSIGREAILRSAKKFPQQSNSEGVSHDLLAAAASPETDLSSQGVRKRGKTISFSQSGGWVETEANNVESHLLEYESHPVEWIMLTRSDPGGSVPRFMVERGTPSSIVADASKFLDWACSSNVDESDEDTFGPSQSATSEGNDGRRSYEKSLHDYETNGHLAGLDGSRDPAPIERQTGTEGCRNELGKDADGGIYSMVTGAVGAAGAIVASHTPAVITNHLPSHMAIINPEHAKTTRRMSTSSSDTTSSGGSFVSAYERYEDDFPSVTADNLSTKSESSFVRSRPTSQQEKELERLEDRKRKLNEKLAKTRERELSKRSEDSQKEAQTIARAGEKHQKEIAKQEEKYKKEMAKLTTRREKEEKKAEEKRRKALERDERTKMSRELAEIKAERDILKVERDLLRKAMADLQAENTALAARVGKLGATGEAVLREVKEEISSGGRLRAVSLKGLSGSSKGSSLRSVEIGSSHKENIPH